MKRGSALISRIMTSVRSKDTRPELELQRQVRALGRSFKLHSSKLPGKPDLIFPRERLAIFVDGDFWHGRQWRLRGLSSLEQQFRKSKNAAYWIRKISQNIHRDLRTRRKLRRLGWRVMRIWESDLQRYSDRCLERIRRMMARRGSS